MQQQASAETGDYAAHVVDSPTQEHPASVRQQHHTGRNVTIDDSHNGNGDMTSEDTLAGNSSHQHHHGGISDKLHNIRHRSQKRGQKDVQVTDEKRSHRPQPQRSFSTGPRGFVERVMTGLSEPRPAYNQEPTWRQSGIAIVKASWLNVLLVFIPISWAMHFAGVNDTIVFVMSFLAIIPLAKLLGFGTEELALRVGQTLGGLLNATLGNVVELIVAILALVKCELQIVQSSLLGSILSNLLLVLGMCFFAGGLRYSEQTFGETGAQLNSSLLVVSVIAILIPAGFFAAFSDAINESVVKQDVLAMSRGAAVILLVTYVAYMLFQLWSHPHLFAEESGEHAVKHQERKVGKHRMFRQTKQEKRAVKAAADADAAAIEAGEEENEEEEETPSVNLWSCIILLLVVAALVGVTAEWLVDSINGLTASGAISQQWVGLILLPIVGNAAEHVTAVTVAYKNKLDLSIGVAVGSSIQISLFVIPLLVVLGWIIGKPLSLLFDPFESIVLFLSVLLANYTMQDSKSNWLEGWLLMNLYLIIAVAFWYYPSANTAEARLLVC